MPKPDTLPRTLVDTLPTSLAVAADVATMLGHIAKLSKEADKASKKGAINMARAFVVLHRLKEKFGDLDKAYSELFERYKTQVMPELLEAEGVTSLPLAEGFRVGISHAWRASIREGQRDKAFHWLRTHGFVDLITTTVNSSTLSAAAKHAMTEDNVEFPTDLFNVALVPNTSVTGISK